MEEEIKLPELPNADYPAGTSGLLGESCYTADQMRGYAQTAMQIERERCLGAVAALATNSRDREERDVIARCWQAMFFPSAKQARGR